MKRLLILLAITSNQCFVQCFLINFANDTERFRRSADNMERSQKSSDNMEKILFGSYNDYIESKSCGKAFLFFLLN